jgi:predicted nucleic acid-binding protein
MRLLLDTSAYSWFMRGHQEVSAVLQSADSVAVNPILLGELRAGFQNGRYVDKNKTTLAEFLSSPRVHVVPIDEETAERYAVILHGLKKIGTPIPTNDLWIAASAMQYGLTILTTDAHFKHVVQVLVHHVTIP